MNDKNEITASIAIAVICGFLLFVYLGAEGFINYILKTFVGWIAISFLLVTIIDIIVRGKKIHMPTTLFFIMVGVVFMIINMKYNQWTVFMAFTSILEYMIAVCGIKLVIIWIKQSMEGL